MDCYQLNRLLPDPQVPFSIHPYYLEAGAVIEPHSHNFIEAIVVIEGNALHIGPGGQEELREGDTFVIWPGEWHSYRTGEQQFFYHYNLLMDVQFYRKELLPFFKSLTPRDLAELDTAYWAESFRPWEHRRIRLQASALTALEHQLREAADHCRDRRVGMARLKLAIWQWMLAVSRESAEQLPEQGAARDAAVMDRLDWVIRMIRSNYTVPFSLSYASRLSDLSPSTFSQLFKERTGETLIEFRNRVRLEAAAERIVRENGSITDIAGDCGFSDLSFFYMQFKNKYKLTPREYRKLYRG